MGISAIYARKSTESEERQVQSLDDQLHAMRDHAARDGVFDCKEYVEAKSAKEPGKRPIFAELMAAVQAGHIDTIYTWSINRLARNAMDGGIIAHLLQTGKLSAIKTIDKTYLPDDNAILMAVESAVATQFIKDLQKNVVRGLRSRVERGWFPGKAPIGYVNNPVTREIDLDPIYFPVVRQLWDLALTGQYNVVELTEHSKKLNLTSGRITCARNGVSKSYVHKLFRNPFYTGKFLLRGELFNGRHKPMVSRGEFDKVQTVLARGLDHRPIKHKLTYAGIIRCGVCGCVVSGERRVKYYRTTNRTAEYLYYHCSGSKGCSKESISEQAITACLLEVARRIQIPGSFAEWCKEALVQSVEQDFGQAVAEQQHLTGGVLAERRRLERLNTMRLDGEVSAAEYIELKQEVTARMLEFERSVQQASGRDEIALQVLFDHLDVAVQAESLDDQETEALRVFATNFTEKCLLTLEKLEIKVDSILEKIASFEPLRNGSQTPKRGDRVPSNSLWYLLVRDLRNLGTEEVLRQEAKKSLTGVNKSRRDLPTRERRLR